MLGRVGSVSRTSCRFVAVVHCVGLLLCFCSCQTDETAQDDSSGPSLSTRGSLDTASASVAAGAPGAAGTGLASGGAAGALASAPAATASAVPMDPSVARAPAGAATDPLQPSVPRPDGWAPLSHERGATPDYARLFDADRVRRIDIEMSAEARQRMLDDLTMLLGDPAAAMSAGGIFPGFPGPGNGAMGMNEMRNPVDLVGADPVYVPVTVRYEGGIWNHVGMRYKGNSSLASAWRQGIKKIGFRLDFDRYEDEHPEILDQRFYGFGKMTFSSAYRDPSLIRDKLAGEVLEGLGLTAARCAFYQVYVNAEYWGLYTMIEDPADQLLEAQFADKSGNLYKPDGEGATWTRFDMESFSKKSNEMEADYSDVMAAIAALHAPRDDAEAWRSGLDAVFDTQSFLDVLAFSRATGHWDSYGVMAHNYYLYADPQDENRLHWISWDHNLTWQNSFRGGLGVMMDEVTEDWPLIRFLLDDPVYRERYQQALQRTLDAPVLQAAMFEARATALHTLVQPYVLGGDGVEGEQAPYTFISDPQSFVTALTDPSFGLLTTAGTLRQALQDALL